jgi:hypothetical protein
MDRNREGRRSSSNMAASNGLSRRRQQRTTRDSTGIKLKVSPIYI